MKNYRSLLTAIATVFIFYGCHQNETPNPKSPFEKNEKQDELAHTFGKLLASSLKDKPIRDFVKSEASAQFDGDYDILFAMSKDKEIEMDNGRGKMTFAAAIAGSDANSRTDMSEYDLLLTELAYEYPTMQISVPQLEDESAETWDTGSSTPLVAILNSDFDEHTTQYVTAYNEYGETFSLSVNEEPEELVIVISQSESVLAFEKPLDPYANVRTLCEQPTSVYSTDAFNYYYDGDIMEYNSCLSGDTGTSGGTTPTPTYACDRDDKSGENRRDVLLKAKFVSKDQMRDLERWIQGKPEMYTFIVFAKNNNTNNPLFGYTLKGANKAEWYYRDFFGNLVLQENKMRTPIVTWDKEDYGKTMKYYWKEKDKPWLTATLTMNLETTVEVLNTEVLEVYANGEVQLTLGGKWQTAGDAYVEYCNNTDDNGTKYGTQFVNFWVNQENS